MKLFSFILLIVLFSCSLDEESTENANAENIPFQSDLINKSDSLQTALSNSEKKSGSFFIGGQVDNASGISIKLELPTPNGIQVVSETIIKEDGTFELKGDLYHSINMYNLQLENNNELVLALPLVSDDSISINTSLSKFIQEPKINGASWTKQANEIISKNYGYKKKFNEILNDKNRNESQKEPSLYYLNDLIDKNNIKSIKKNIKSPYNLILFPSLAPMTSFEKWDFSNLDIMKKVMAEMLKQFPNSQLVKMFNKQVVMIESAYKDEMVMKSGGVSAPDFVALKPDGQQLRLSSLKGKYVLLDFWASWCAPCRKENPNVVRLYKKYKSKGFTVFSFSLDDRKDAWLKAIKEDGLIWKNHGTDFKAWKTPLASIYRFNSIPHTVLIDKNGKIIAKNLRGEKLEEKLIELFD